MPYEVQVTVEFKRSEFVQGGLGESQAGASFFNSHNFNSNIAWSAYISAFLVMFI